MINFELTAEQKKWKRICKELAEDFAKRAAEYDRERTSPVENYRKLNDAGLFGLMIPKKYGGLGCNEDESNYNRAYTGFRRILAGG